MVKCLNSTLDATCSTSNNLVKFVEVVTTDLNGIQRFACFPHGAASLNVQYRMTVDQPQPSGNGWASFIDGVPYETNGFAAYLIWEGAEHVADDSCSGSWGGFAAFSESQSWDRWTKSTLTWTTVQSSYLDAGCWVPSGGNPGTFYFSR